MFPYDPFAGGRQEEDYLYGVKSMGKLAGNTSDAGGGDGCLMIDGQSVPFWD